MSRSQFRAWLVDRVSETKFPRQKSFADLDKLARYMGVQPDVIEEALRRRAARIERVGRYPSYREVHGKEDHYTYTRVLGVYAPPIIAEKLNQICESRSVPFSSLGRAIVHTLLLSPKDPAWSGRGWMYRGRRYAEDRKKGHVGATKHQIVVSTGADIALGRRAERAGVPKSALIRGAILDVLEGRVKKLVYVDTSSMYNDPDRYWRPDGPQADD